MGTESSPSLPLPVLLSGNSRSKVGQVCSASISGLDMLLWCRFPCKSQINVQ